MTVCKDLLPAGLTRREKGGMRVLDTVIGIISGLIYKICEIFFSPFKELFQFFQTSPDSITNFSFFDPVYSKLQIVGAALLVLIATWQSFKAMFAWMGFECEEPWRIAARTTVFGFLILNAKDVCLTVGVETFKAISGFIWKEVSFSSSISEIVSGFFEMPASDVISGGSDNLLKLYLYYKFIRIAFRFIERLVLTTVSIMASPLAFAAGCSQPTKGFFQGWVKLFVGNLIIQILQIAMFICIILYYDWGLDTFIVRFAIAITLIKILEKLEDILRDISVSVGVGRDFSSAMQKVTQAIHTGVQIHSVTKAVGGFASAFTGIFRK